jgi:hypothetical protein
MEAKKGEKEKWSGKKMWRNEEEEEWLQGKERWIEEKEMVVGKICGG